MRAPLCVVVAAGAEASAGLRPALESAGFQVHGMAPGEADPVRLRSLAARILILEAGADFDPAQVRALWKSEETDTHLPVLLLHPPGPPPLDRRELDEPLDTMPLPAPPAEAVARVEGLAREWRVRIFRRSFHDLSQPLTIARAYAQKALRLTPADHPAAATVQELDRQVERIFRVVEDLQKKRHA